MKPVDEDSIVQKEKDPSTPVMQRREWIGRLVCGSLENVFIPMEGSPKLCLGLVLNNNFSQLYPDPPKENYFEFS